MTACFRLMRALQQHSRPDPGTLCATCVYFSRNLDPTELPDLPEACGLGFLPGNSGCVEMRTDDCSARK